MLASLIVIIYIHRLDYILSSNSLPSVVGIVKKYHVDLFSLGYLLDLFSLGFTRLLPIFLFQSSMLKGIDWKRYGPGYLILFPVRSRFAAILCKTGYKSRTVQTTATN